MKVYFACFIRGGRDDAVTYAELTECIKSKPVFLTEIFNDNDTVSKAKAGIDEFIKDLGDS